MSDPVRRFYARLREWFPPETTFTRREAARKETASKSSVYGWVGNLYDADLLDQTKEGKGSRPAEYRLSAEGLEAEATALLPPLEKVFPETDWNHGNKP